MRLPLLITFLLIALPLACHAQKWDDQAGGIGYAKNGYDTLDAAITAFPNANPDGLAGKAIFLGAFLTGDDKLQAELLDALHSDAPQALKKALASPGKIHDPALDPLTKPFKAALLETSLARVANAALAKQGLAITDISMEQFYIDKTQKPPRLCASVWLKIGPAK